MRAAVASATEQDAALTRKAWLLVVFTWVTYGLNYCERSSLRFSHFTPGFGLHIREMQRGLCQAQQRDRNDSQRNSGYSGRAHSLSKDHDRDEYHQK